MSMVTLVAVLIIGLVGYFITVQMLRKSALNELKNTVNLIYGQIQTNIDASIKNYLRSIAEKDKDLVNYYYLQYKAGKVTESEAKRQAAQALLSKKIWQELEGSGYQVAEAGNGREGLVAAQKERPDLIMLDLIMPGMDGLEMLAALKCDPATREIPMIVLSIADEKEKALRHRSGCLFS